jgi:hypothetical protein
MLVMILRTSHLFSFSDIGEKQGIRRYGACALFDLVSPGFHGQKKKKKKKKKTIGDSND